MVYRGMDLRNECPAAWRPRIASVRVICLDHAVGRYLALPRTSALSCCSGANALPDHTTLTPQSDSRPWARLFIYHLQVSVHPDL